MEPQPWRVVAASVPGTGHLKTGKPCQDAHQWKTLPDRVLVAAVSDGAGSAALSEAGAAVAVRSTIDFAARSGASGKWPHEETAWRVWLGDALKAVRAAVFEEAEHRRVPPRDLAATLLAVVSTPAWTAAAQIGDGATVIAEDLGSLRALTRPCTGEYLNETVFLTSDDALESAQFAVHAGRVNHLAMLSDGLQMLALKMPQGEPHPAFFQPMFRLIREEASEFAQDRLTQFLRSSRIGARTDDDLTLLLADLSSPQTPSHR